MKKCVKKICDEKKLDAVRTHTRAYVQRVKPTKTNVQIVQNTLEENLPVGGQQEINAQGTLID